MSIPYSQRSGIGYTMNMKYLLSFLLILGGNTLYSQITFSLSSSVPVELNNKKVYLIIYDYYSLNTYSSIDSTNIVNNAFSFSGVIGKPCESARLYIKKKGVSSGSFNFVLDSGINTMIVSGVGRNDPYPSNSLSKAVLLNSKSNLIHQKIDSTVNFFYKKYAKPISGNLSVRVLERDIEKALYSNQLDILSQYPDEYYSLIQLYQIASSSAMRDNLDTPLAAFKKLGSKISSTPLGQEFYKRKTAEVNAYNSAKAGKPTPEFTVTTSKGTQFTNKSLAGKPYVIAFSATWCIPCKVYEKKLKVLYEKYHAKGLEVVYFNLDDNVTKWHAQITSNKLNWINVSEKTKMQQSKIAKQFFVQLLPLYILVDKNGIIAYNGDESRDSDFEHLEINIEKVLRD